MEQIAYKTIAQAAKESVDYIKARKDHTIVPLKTRWNKFNKIIIILLFMIAIATLAYFGALTFAESLGEPIAALDKAAKEVSEGRLDQKIDEDIGWGEFKNLIASFNSSSVKLLA